MWKANTDQTPIKSPIRQSLQSPDNASADYKKGQFNLSRCQLKDHSKEPISHGPQSYDKILCDDECLSDTHETSHCELIQNADDAGATEMKILYQGRRINEEIHSEKETRKHLRAPALVFYNDSVFSDNDWTGIRSIYTTDKSQDPLKIGRFGLGFKSIFHMTDFPCIISGDKFMFINPLERNQDKVCTIIRLINLRRWKSLDATDIMNAFCDTFSFSKSIFKTGFYSGSMFWFPLRQKPSRISDIVYSEQEVNVLLESFMPEAERSVMFSKTLCKVEIYFDMPDVNKGNTSSLHVLSRKSFGKRYASYSVQIDNESKNLIEKKKDLNDYLTALGRNVPEESKHWTNITYITSEQKVKEGDSKQSRSRWLILNYLKGGQLSKRTLELLKDDDLCYHHIVGLAVPVIEDFVDEEDETKEIGRVFCNQPLPDDTRNFTGLPVHLNAFFALGNNRREVKWEDRFSSSKQTDKAIEWNHVLVSEMLPWAYSCLYQEMIELCRKSGNKNSMVTSVYSVLPDMDKVNKKWETMARTFLHIVKDSKMVCTMSDKPVWAHIDSVALLSYQSFIYTHESCRNTVVKLLSEDGVECAIVPKLVLNVSANFKEVTPDYICEHLTNYTRYKTFPLKQREDLLQVLTKDSRYTCLEGLELLPLADSSFTCFRDKKITFCEPKEVIELFPGKSDRFLSPDIRSGLRDVIRNLDKKGTCGRFTDLDAGNAVKMTREVLIEDIENGFAAEIHERRWKTWLEGIWKFIQTRYLESLDQFKNLRLFPLYSEQDWETADSISLCSLTDLLFYMPEVENTIAMKYIVGAFDLLSVKVVQKMPDWIKQEIVSPYMYTDNSNNLLKLLEHIVSKAIKRFNKNVSLEQQSAFLSFLAGRLHTDLRERTIKNLKSLKLFRQYTHEEQPCTIVSIQQNQNIYTGENFPVFFFKPVIRTSCEAEQILAKRLGVICLDGREMVLGSLNMFGKYSPEEVKVFLNWILLKPKYVDDEEIKSTIIQKQIAFVECEDGPPKQPSALFDPSDELLVRLFKLDSMLPQRSGVIEAQTLISLRKLGLRCRGDLAHKDIERICRSISSNMVQNATISSEKANALLEVLNQYPKLINVESMNNRKIVPIQVPITQSDTYPRCLTLRNRCSPERICSPSEVKSVKYINLIGSVLIVVDCGNHIKLADKFRWDDQPEIKDVVMHLKNVVLSYKRNLKPSFILMITEIYKWLAEHKDKENVQSEFSNLKINFIWNGECFVSLKNIYIESSSSDLDMQPFVTKLPSELQDLTEFFSSLGCTRQQNFEMYINVLDAIKDESEIQPESLQGSSVLQMVIAILNRLKEKHLNETENREILVPVYNRDITKVTLKPAKQCIYFEMDATDIQSFDKHDLYYIHPTLPASTADALGVQNIRRHMLSETDAFEEWGQQERLTVRIRNLISRCYVDGFSVIKEMFQNAEDACASKFYVMIDERENKDFQTNLLSDGMSHCQGPAMWIYNDAVFSEEDFTNIKQLGVGAKVDKPEKVGKFGLGFCSVYNMTDVPSLLSDMNVIIFDPHTSFLENALPRKSPGIKIDLSKAKNQSAMSTTFCNQLKPYEGIFGCEITSQSNPQYHGTLFRLPLRRRESEISDKIYTKDETEALLQKIKELSSNLLIFNRSIKHIKVFHLPDDGTDPSEASLIFKVNGRKQNVNGNASFDIVEEVCKEKEMQCLERSHLRQLQQVTISTENYDARSNIENHENKVTWLASWATGTSKDLIDISNSVQGSLPLAAVAIPVRSCQVPYSNYQVLKLCELPDGFYKSGRYFCFLPISQEHPFEFHINGKFNISVDRQTLKTRSDDDKTALEAPWNELLISDAVVGATILLLENITSTESDIFQIWPEKEHEDDTFGRRLVKSLYTNVTGERTFRIFQKNEKKFDLAKCIFLDPDVREDCEIGNVMFQVLELLCSKIVIDVNRDVYNLLYKSNKSKIKAKTVTSEKFLMNYFLPKLHCLPQEVTIKSRDSILKYAIGLHNQKVCHWLKGHKVIPTDAGDLKCASFIIDPESKVSRLFPRNKGFFPDSEFISKELSDSMKEIGMRFEIISDDMVLEIAKRLENEHSACFKCMEELCAHLLSYLCEHIQEHKKLFTVLRNIACLPVMMKPEYWPFQWHADTYKIGHIKRQSCQIHERLPPKDLTFQKPTALYTREYKDLVSCLRLVIDSDFCHKLEITERIAEAGLDEVFCYLGLQGSDKIGHYIADVVQQLITLSDSYNVRMLNNNVILTIEHTVESLYSYLEKHIHLKEICKLQNRNVIWVSGSFVAPYRLSHDDQLEGCGPFLFSYSNTAVARYPRLCRVLQIREHFCARDVASELQNIKNEYGDVPVNDNVICTSINLLKFLKNCFDREVVQDTDKFISESTGIRAIYAPDEHLVIRNCAEMCFDDSHLTEKTETMVYVHENVPRKAARAFGVKSKQLKRLDETSEDVVAFFQHESLVHRLQRLVDCNSVDTSIFKELLQNADDAGASEIIFIKDMNTYGYDTIFDERSKPLQGPALCVYNDSSFSKADLEGITRLGRGSKYNDPSKIGKFGVGFNTVYNLTDAPSFLTKGNELENGETVCFFDPLAKFIPGVTTNKPGKRFKNVNYIRENHRDVLEGYHERRVFSHISNGTIFRFPLRTESSDIKREVVNMFQLSSLLDIFCEELKNVMIFLNNLKSVRVLTYSGNIYTEEYLIEMSLSESDNEKRSIISEAKRSLCEILKTGKHEHFACEQESAEYCVTLQETKQSEKQAFSSFRVIQTIGFDKFKPIHESVKEECARGNIALLPIGGIACCENDSRSNENGIAFCSLPLPTRTGLPIHINGHFVLENEKRRTLWTSENTGNCHRTQWNLMIVRQMIARSYTLLLKSKHSVLKERFSDKVISQEDVKQALDVFFSLFPIHKHLTDFYWKELSNAVYRDIATEYINFLPYIQKEIVEDSQPSDEPQKVKLSWTSLHVRGGQFPAYHSDDNTGTRDPKFSLQTILRSVGMRIVSVPKQIRDSFEEIQQTFEHLAPKRVIKYITSGSRKYNDRCQICTDTIITETVFHSKENVKVVFEYCLQNKKKFVKSLKDLPIMLTQDGILRKLSNTDPLFVTQYADFFPDQRNIFLHSHLVDLILHVYKTETEFQADVVKGLKQSLKVFTIKDFVDLVDKTDLFSKKNVPVLHYTNIPSEQFLKSFWDFFKQQLPAFKQNKRPTVVSNALRRLKALPLIPACTLSLSRKMIVAVSDIDRLLNVDSFKSNAKLQDIIRRFDLLELDETMLSESDGSDISSYELILEQIPSSLYPGKLLRCFVQNYLEINKVFIKVEEAELVLKYFADSISVLPTQDIRNLKKMQLFLSQSGELISMEKYKQVVMVPKNIPQDGLNKIATKTECILLRDIGLVALYKHLDIESTNVEDVYINVIIPNQSLLTRDQFYVHIDFICRAVMTGELYDQSRLLEKLKVLPFIDVGNGKETFACVQDLFYDQPPVNTEDTHELLFEILCRKEELLPKELRIKHITDVFKLLGLRCNMSLKLFEKFADRIANDGKVTISGDVQKQSLRLFEQLLRSCNHFRKQKECLQKLSVIKFIVPKRVEGTLTNIQQQLNDSAMISIAKSVIPTKENINTCWTTSNILPSWVDERDDKCNELAQMLGVLQKPQDEELFRHCRNIFYRIEHLIHKPAFPADLVTDIVRDIYTALGMSGMKRCPDSLKQVPMIFFPEHPIIVKASKVVINCKTTEEILPYLYEAPIVFSQYKSVFLSLGAIRQPTIDIYIRLLSRIEQESINRDLSSLQYDASFKAMTNLFLLLKNEKVDLSCSVNTLYLLNEEKRLMDASTLVMCDNVYLYERLQKGKDIQLNYMIRFHRLCTKELRMDEIIDCFGRIDRSSRPQLLSEIVDEVVTLSEMEEKDPSEAIEIEDFFHNDVFIDSVCRLVRHAFKAENKLWTDEIEDTIVQKFKHMKLKNVSGIKTFLFLRNGSCLSSGIEGVVNNTQEQKTVHVTENGGNPLVYFETSDNQNWFSDVVEVIALHLNQIFNGVLKDKLLFVAQRLLQCNSLQLCQDLLDRKKIEAYSKSIINNTKMQHSVKQNASSIFQKVIAAEPTAKMQYTPKPGTFVPRALHTYLDKNDSNHNFSEYTCVALELDDGETEDKTPTYIFVEMREEIDHHCKIDIGEEYPTKVDRNKLYIVQEQALSFENKIENEPYECYSEGKRWQKQANSDLKDARNALQHGRKTAFNWVCYRGHQAAEKSLKAALYAKDANKMRIYKTSHNLRDIAQELSTELVDLAEKLHTVTNVHTCMRYPDTVSSQKIPAERYTREDAENVVKISQKILDFVERVYLRRKH